MVTDPLRRLAAGTLASAVGSGAWYTSWALFLTREVKLAPAQVGLGMTLTTLAGVLAATPLGRLADRRGPRGTYAALLAVQGAASFAYLGVHAMAGFLLVAGAAGVAAGGAGGPRNALVLAIAGSRERIDALATLRSVSHVGWALGAAAGAAVIGVGTPAAYAALLVLNGVSYLVYAGLVLTVPAAAREAGAAPGAQVAGAGAGRRRAAGAARAQTAPRGRALRDVPYVTLAGLVGVLALSWAMLSTGLPLWIAGHTQAATSLGAVVVFGNSVAIAALQVPVARRVPTPGAAARAAVAAALALMGACGLFALTAGRGGVPAGALILGGGVLHVTGELLFVAASWGLSVPLMPDRGHGEHQGVFAMGEQLALTVAPALMTTLVAGWGAPGWGVLALVFAVPALATVPVTGWALRTRTPATA